jgi:hypothetical protein
VKAGAIYRIVEMVDGATLYLNTGSEIIDVFAEFTAEGFIYNISIVDKIPQLDVGDSYENLYIVRETGEVYAVYDGEVRNEIDNWIKDHYADAYGTDFEFRGIAESTDGITESGFYTVFGQKEKVLHYFIANNVPVWRFNKETNGWDELMSYDEWQNQ